MGIKLDVPGGSGTGREADAGEQALLDQPGLASLDDAPDAACVCAACGLEITREAARTEVVPIPEWRTEQRRVDLRARCVAGTRRISNAPSSGSGGAPGA